MIRPDTADSMSMDLDLSVRATTPSAWRRMDGGGRDTLTPSGSRRSSVNTPRSRAGTPRTSGSRTGTPRSSGYGVRSELPRSSPSFGVSGRKSHTSSRGSPAPSAAAIPLANRPAWRGVSPKLVTTAGPAVPKPKYRKTNLRKSSNYVDESLFGGTTVSTEEQHAELHKSIRTEPFMAGRKEAKPNRRAKARDHTRIDFTKPCEMPGSGSTHAATKYKRTDTLFGARSASYPSAKPGQPPHQSSMAKHMTHQPHRESRQPKAPPMKSSWVHANVTPTGNARAKSRPANSIWGHHPDV